MGNTTASQLSRVHLRRPRVVAGHHWPVRPTRYTTLKRVREIGIRVALGARPAQIRALILSHGMQLLLMGSVIGLVGAFALSRALQSVLFEVGGIDPGIYLGVGLILFSATLLAAWIPARRASRVDPIVALHTE